MITSIEDNSHLHVLTQCEPLDALFLELDDHIDCKYILHLHALTQCELLDALFLQLDDHIDCKYILHLHVLTLCEVSVYLSTCLIITFITTIFTPSCLDLMWSFRLPCVLAL